MSIIKTKEKGNITFQLWDEIAKAFVVTMPEQLFPLIEEVYGIHYDKGTSVVFLSTEQPTFPEGTVGSLNSQLMDLSVLINGTDYYHIECQMKNDHQMVIRMISYDMHFAMQHCAEEDNTTGEMILHFPRSVVLYPEKNNAIPNWLRCKIIFQDESEHTYRIPTVRIQDYSLEEIKQKHLLLFIPYVLLRLRPGLNSKGKIDEAQLTKIVDNVIVILEEEKRDRRITDNQERDILDLFRRASKQLFKNYPKYHEEVMRMTEPKIKTLSMQLAELTAERDSAIAEKDSALAERDAEIEALTKIKDTLIEKDAEIETLMKIKDTLVEKDAEIAELKKRLAAFTS